MVFSELSFHIVKGETVSTIAFIGLGIMGKHMAGHLVSAGHTVVGYDRNAANVAALAEKGGKAAPSVAEAVRGADIAITMVPDSPHVEEVLADGLLEAATAGLLYIDMSTIRPDVARSVAERCAAHGVRAIDAPVSGGEAGAQNASLSIMVGGAADDFAAALPVLQVMGGTVVHVGPAGAGQTVKAANQLMVGGIYELMAEALAFLEAFGVDTEAAFRVLNGGLAHTRIMELKGEAMRARSFAPGFRIDLHHKDMGIITSAAREAGVVIPVGALVAQLMQAARQNGDGGLDHSALFRGVLRLNGRDL